MVVVAVDAVAVVVAGAVAGLVVAAPAVATSSFDRSWPSAVYCRPWPRNRGDKAYGSVELQLSTTAAPRGGPSDQLGQASQGLASEVQ